MKLTMKITPSTRTFADIPHNEVFEFDGESLTKKVYDEYHFAVDAFDGLSHFAKSAAFPTKPEMVKFSTLALGDFFLHQDMLYVKVFDFQGVEVRYNSICITNIWPAFFESDNDGIKKIEVEIQQC